MRQSQDTLSKPWRLLVLAVLVLAAAASVVLVTAASAPAAPMGQIVPSHLPVYSMTAPVVDSNSVQALAGLFNMAPSVVYTDTTHAGTHSWQVYDPEIGNLVEEYEATGGFYAFNPNLAFTETLAITGTKPVAVCNFLQSKGFFPKDTAPGASDCQNQNLDYPVQLLHLNAVTNTVPYTLPITTVIGELWQVPLAADVGPDIGAKGQVTIPIGGPGGHLSLLITDVNSPMSLDDSLPGLQALANPYFGLQKAGPIALYPVYTPTVQDVLTRVDPLVPAGRGVLSLTLGTPQLIYYVDDPAVPQQYMMPMWTYPDAKADVGGQTIPLRTLALPAVTGFLPEVAITNPAAGTNYPTGGSLDLTASITQGHPPYMYSLAIEGGPTLVTGVANISGTHKINTGALPPGGRPFETDVRFTLLVTDTLGANAQDALPLGAPDRLFVPQTFLSALLSQGLPNTVIGPQPAGPRAPTATRTMGVEWVSGYNGVLPDLPAVPPDGRGFYDGMRGQGWSGVFNWTNNAAWAKDWVDCSLGGIDCTFGVDRAEFIYFAGHGSPARIFFGVNRDTTSAFAGDARFQNVRWASFATCQTMRAGPFVSLGNPPITNWIDAFQGAYLLTGFHSNMADVAFGPRFVNNMAPVKFLGFTLFQRSIREAWVTTAFQMNAGKPAYIYAVTNSFNPANMVLPDSSASLPPLDPAAITHYRWVWWDE